MLLRGASPLSPDRNQARDQNQQTPVVFPLLLLTSLVILMTMILVTVHAGRQPNRNGELLAVFPADTSSDSILAAVSHANGKLMADTFVPGVVEVTSRNPEFSGDLLALGASLVLPQPSRMLAVGACSYLGLTAYDHADRSVRTAPM